MYVGQDLILFSFSPFYSPFFWVGVCAERESTYIEKGDGELQYTAGLSDRLSITTVCLSPSSRAEQRGTGGIRGDNAHVFTRHTSRLFRLAI